MQEHRSPRVYIDQFMTTIMQEKNLAVRAGIFVYCDVTITVPFYRDVSQDTGDISLKHSSCVHVNAMKCLFYYKFSFL